MRMRVFHTMFSFFCLLSLHLLLLSISLIPHHRFVHGKHSKKTAAFVKACLAFCHITIPSLDDIFLRLHLLVEVAQVALVNQMTGQSEALLKAAISLVPDVPVRIFSFFFSLFFFLECLFLVFSHFVLFVECSNPDNASCR